MKKIFQLNSPNKMPGFDVSSIKHEIKKSIAREKRKPVPKGFSSWELECRIGESAKKAAAVQVEDINSEIDQIVTAKKIAFYLEVIAKPCK